MNNSHVVIGNGTVGVATAKVFAIKNFYSRSEKTVEFGDLYSFEFLWICLPTPVTELGYYDMSIVEGFLEEFYKTLKDDVVAPIIVIRSTVRPGFASEMSKLYPRLRFVSNPEFLSEDTAIEDALHPDIVVIGTDDQFAGDQVEAVYRGRFKLMDLIRTSSVTAELIKLSLNAFFATKVVFANSVYNYAQRLGADYKMVSRIINRHKWGSKNHFEIFHKGGRGAGGKCLKKDISAMAHHSEQPFFRIVDEVNKELLEKSKK